MSHWISNERFNQMMQGVQLLENLLHQWVESGIGSDPKLFANRLEALAERLIDYKCGGVARKLRILADTIKNELSDWLVQCTLIVTELYHCINNLKFSEYHNVELHLDLWIWIGLPIKKEQVLEGQGITDEWMVMGQVSEKEENLRVIKTFFLGRLTKRFGVLIEYLVGYQQIPFKWLIGKTYNCTMHFYPGKYGNRVINAAIAHESYDRWPEKSSKDLEAVKKMITDQYIHYPLFSYIPMIVKAKKIIKSNNNYFLIGHNSKLSLSQLSLNVLTKMMILGSDGVSEIFGLYQDSGFTPLSMNYRGEFHVLYKEEKK
jgi:hypothetical protein